MSKFKIGDKVKVVNYGHLMWSPAHQAHAMGYTRENCKVLKEEDINAILFERNRDRSMEDIVAFLGETHALVMEELSSWKFEDLSQPRFEEDVEKRPVGLFVAGNTYLHYREHRKSIETLLRSESEE